MPYQVISYGSSIEFVPTDQESNGWSVFKTLSEAKKDAINTVDLLSHFDKESKNYAKYQIRNLKKADIMDGDNTIELY